MAVLKYRNSSNGQLQLLNIPIVQVATIPEAKEDYNNKIIQFIGETTDEFINGYFYKCNGTSWDRINVQPSSSGGGGSSIVPNPEDLSEEATELTGLRIDDNDYKISGGGGTDQVQSDWTETDTTAKSYIKNKPTDLVHVDSSSNLKDEEGNTISPKTTVENIKDAEGNTLESLLESAGMSAEVTGTRLVLGSGGGAGGGSHTYSTEEQVVGTWIDGSTIYEKTTEINFGVNTTQDFSLTNFYANDYNFIINGLIIRTNNGDGFVPITIWKNDNEFLQARALDTLSHLDGCKMYVIIQYTKTTD